MSSDNLVTRVKKNPFVQGMVRRVNFYLFSRSLAHLQPIAPRRSGAQLRRLNLVVPTIRREHVFGGLATALRLYRVLSARLGDGVGCRIILTEYAPGAPDLALFSDHTLVPGEEESSALRQILPCVARGGKSIPVADGDIFLATQWTTAYLAQRLAVEQAALYGRSPKSLLYLIQDFEPGFYPFSSDYVLSESTYRSDVPQIAIFNSSPLRDYFRSAGYVFGSEHCFEPVLNSRLKEELASAAAMPKERVIFVYGRPSTPRNAFPLIVAGLRLWAAAQPAGNGWRIVSAGEPHPDVPLGNGYLLSSLGKLDLAEYARLLRRSAVGIGLMLSPHPSYPPLEMAHFGLLTVTNRFMGKDLSRWHDNIVNLPAATPEGVAAAVTEACGRFMADPGAGSSGASRMAWYLGEGPEFPFLDDLVRELPW